MKTYSLSVFFFTAGLVFWFDKHSACLMWKLSMNSLIFFLFFFPETKTKGLASSWRIYFRTLGIDHHGFLQNIWNQAHETHLLNSSKPDCIDCYSGFMVVIHVLCMCLTVVVGKQCWNLASKGSFEVISSAPFPEKSLTVVLMLHFCFTLSCFKCILMVFWAIFLSG